MSDQDGWPGFLTMAEVAAILRVSVMTARRLIRCGELESCRFGSRCIRVRETALREYLQKASTSQQDGPPP